MERNVMIEWNDLGCVVSNYIVDKSFYNLTPYLESKHWYDDKDNFPKILCVRLGNQTMYQVCHSKESFLYLSSFEYRLATSEEMDSLKLKDK